MCKKRVVWFEVTFFSGFKFQLGKKLQELKFHHNLRDAINTGAFYVLNFTRIFSFSQTVENFKYFILFPSSVVGLPNLFSIKLTACSLEIYSQSEFHQNCLHFAIRHVSTTSFLLPM